MKRLRFIPFVILLFVGLILGAIAPQEVLSAPEDAKPIELIFSTWTPPVKSPDTIVVNNWLDEVEKRTKGKVHFTRHYAGALGRPPDQITLAQQGIADVSFCVASIAGRYPMTILLSLPWLFPSSTVATKVVSQLWLEFPELQRDFPRVKTVAVGTTDVFMPFFVDKVTKMEDMKGMKIRVGGVMDKVVESLGGVPVGMNIVDVYMSLQKGILQGIISGWNTVRAFKFGEVCKNYPVWEGNAMSIFTYSLSMNLNTWNKLPPDVKKVIDELNSGGADSWFAKMSGPIYDKASVGALNFARGKGGEIYKIDKSEIARWIEKTRPVVNKIIKEAEAKGLPAKRLIERTRALSIEYTKGIPDFKINLVK